MFNHFPPTIHFPPIISHPLLGLALGEIEAFHLFELLLQTRQLKQTHYDKRNAEPLYRLQSSSFPLFVHVDAHDVHLPSSFNYPFFLEGMKRLLEQEHVLVMTEIPPYFADPKTDTSLHIQFCPLILSFYSDTSSHFSLLFPQFFNDVFLDQFYRFFCHWDPDVRFIFHLLLLYSMLRNRRSKLPLLKYRLLLEGVSLRRCDESTGTRYEETSRQLCRKWREKLAGIIARNATPQLARKVAEKDTDSGE